MRRQKDYLLIKGGKLLTQRFPIKIGNNKMQNKNEECQL